MEKATHNPYNIEMFAPVIKSAKGKYLAILSDTSIDRDGERVSKGALENVAQEEGYIAGLLDHENKVLNQIAQWTNIQIKDIDGHTALIAEPKFFKSNPSAEIIKGMLDEGAKIGISIGAIVKNYDDEEFDGKTMRTFTELELLEASFVSIPSNRHSRIVAVAKSFNHKEEIKMKQEDVDKAVKEAVTKTNTLLVEKDAELVALKKELNEAQVVIKEIEDNAEKDKEEVVVVEEENTEEAEEKAAKIIELEAEIKDLKSKSFEKQNFSEEGGDKTNTLSEEDINKAFESGKLPVGKIN